MTDIDSSSSTNTNIICIDNNEEITTSKRLSYKINVRDFIKHHKEEDDGVKVEDYYEVGKRIGEGGCAEVYLCTHKETKTERAMKVIKKKNVKCKEAIINEFLMVKGLDHPNILKAYEVFEDSTQFHLITDVYCGGELFDEIISRGRFDESDAACLMHHILCCVNYLHEQQQIVHRDLKPENILLPSKKNNTQEDSIISSSNRSHYGGLFSYDDIKIIDFGVSCTWDNTNKGTKLMKRVVGTPSYMAPEVYRGRYDNKCDVWSCGIIAFVVLGGYLPFDGDDYMEISDLVLHSWDDPLFDDYPEAWDFISNPAKDFIWSLLSYDRETRPSAREALAHPWLTGQRLSLTNLNDMNDSFLKEQMRLYDAFKNLHMFCATTKLKQAACAYIASQRLSKEEKEKIDVVFRALDADCNGTLDMQELKLGFRELYSKEFSDEEMIHAMGCLSLAGTGDIAYSEFVIATVMYQNLIDDAALTAAFDHFDFDKDGIISRNDLCEIFFNDPTIDEHLMNRWVTPFKPTVVAGATDWEGTAPLEGLKFEDFKCILLSCQERDDEVDNSYVRNSRTQWAEGLTNALAVDVATSRGDNNGKSNKKTNDNSSQEKRKHKQKKSRISSLKARRCELADRKDTRARLTKDQSESFVVFQQ